MRNIRGDLFILSHESEIQSIDNGKLQQHSEAASYTVTDLLKFFLAVLWKSDSKLTKIQAGRLVKCYDGPARTEVIGIQEKEAKRVKKVLKH